MSLSSRAKVSLIPGDHVTAVRVVSGKVKSTFTNDAGDVIEVEIEEEDGSSFIFDPRDGKWSIYAVPL